MWNTKVNFKIELATLSHNNLSWYSFLVLYYRVDFKVTNYANLIKIIKVTRLNKKHTHQS